MVRDFIDLVHDGLWSGLGLAIDSARDRLWVATSWQPMLLGGEGSAASDSGRAGVASYDLATRSLRRRLELPRSGHEPGDICLSPNGDLFVSDGRAGVVYLARADADSLETFVAKGSLVSPQGCAVDRSGERLFVADYALGIAVVRLADRSLSWLARPPDLALNGIDGMILTGGGDRLIGVQNGVEPNRVIALDLDRSGGAIVAARVLARDTLVIREPTHLTILGDSVFFIANGGFGMYDGSGRLRAGVRQEAPRIARLSLRGAPRP